MSYTASDYQAMALNISRDLNANPPRKIAIPSIRRESLPRAAKRARVDCPAPASFRQESMPSISIQSSSSNGYSSPLSSPTTSGSDCQVGSSSKLSPSPNLNRAIDGVISTNSEFTIDTVCDRATNVNDHSKLSPVGPNLLQGVTTLATRDPNIFSRADSKIRDTFLVQDYVGQNVDGTWFRDREGTSQRSKPSPPKVPESKLKTKNSPVQKDATSSAPKRGKKRKLEDENLEESRPDLMNVVEIPKRQGRKRRQATGTKAPKKGLYYENFQQNKPEPVGQPKIWADKRQQLCEALHWYRAYQSGSYISGGIAHGFMFDKEVHDRDKFDEEIIISRAGGGLTEDENGNMVQITDQEYSRVAAAAMRSREQRHPVGVIAAQGNRISPSKLPHYYNVLGWFHITDVWCEMSNGFKRWVIRLEKIDLAEKSWWAATPNLSPTQTPSQISSEGPVITQSYMCAKCHKSSKLIYNTGWACLQPECSEYFVFPHGYEDEKLDYNQEFLKERTRFIGEAPQPLAPPIHTDADLENLGLHGFESPFKRGIVCPECGCCSRRVEWRQWSCENEKCYFVHRINQKPARLIDVIANGLEEEMPKEFYKGGILFSQGICGLYDVHTYTIPGESGEAIGFVRHFKTNSTVNKQKDGPNDLFYRIQKHFIDTDGLKRKAARNKDTVKEILTSHWAVNWGAPYKYGVSQDSKYFSEAPDCILKTVKRLTWAGKKSVTGDLEPFQDFNELLSLGYFEDTRISYHDDGEKELGSTVASLSLGCMATMSFRPKSKSSIGQKRKGAKGNKDAVLSFTLQHGDIMVMHGPLVQKLYEHKVDPHGTLRFALTCRYVRPEMMASDIDREHTKVGGTLPPIFGYEYDGDVNATSGESKLDAKILVSKQLDNILARVNIGEISESLVREMIAQRFKI